MKPILHKSTYDGSTTGTAVGTLSDCVKAHIRERLNGEYELEIDYPLTGNHATQIETGMVVLAETYTISSQQPFRIYHIEDNTEDGLKHIYAHHISYDLNSIIIQPFSATGASNVMSYIASNYQQTSDDSLTWAFSTDLTNTTSTVTLSHPVSVRELLGGMEGSVLDTFGGEYKWDGFTVNLLSARGDDSGAVVYANKNLISVLRTEDNSSAYTHVMAYYYDEDSNTSVCSASYAVSDYDSDGLVQSRTLLKDVTEYYTDTIPTTTELNALASAYAADMSMAASEGVEVDLIDLTKQAESIGRNMYITLGDTIHIRYTPFGIDIKKKIVETTWNVMLERFDSIIVGTPSATLADTIADMESESTPSVANSVVYTSSVTIDSDITEGSVNVLTRVGNVVNLTLRFTSPSTASSGQSIGTIPSGYRPKYVQYSSAIRTWVVGSPAPVGINTGGNIVFYNTAYATSQAYAISATWITTDDYPS